MPPMLKRLKGGLVRTFIRRTRSVDRDRPEATMETRNVAVPERENGMPVSTTDPCEDTQSTTIALHGKPLGWLKQAAQDQARSNLVRVQKNSKQ